MSDSILGQPINRIDGKAAAGLFFVDRKANAANPMAAITTTIITAVTIALTGRAALAAEAFGVGAAGVGTGAGAAATVLVSLGESFA